jgi:hypothetical protein
LVLVVVSTAHGQELEPRAYRTLPVGLTLSLPLEGPHSLKVAAETGAYTSIGADFDMLSVAYQYRW